MRLINEAYLGWTTIFVCGLLFLGGCARNVHSRELSPVLESNDSGGLQLRHDARKTLCEARNYALPDPTGDDLNVPNYRQCYFLQKQLVEAAVKGDTAEIEKALANGAHPDGTYYQSVASLQAVAAGGHFEAATLLLENGADVNRIGHLGSTALKAAASEGKLNLVRLLVESGAKCVYR